MKILALILSSVFVLSACSGSSDGGNSKGPGGQPQKPEAEAFDKMAVGNWRSQSCRDTGDGGTYYKMVTVAGHGKASIVYNVYNSPNCTGTPTPVNKQDFTYTVDNYANGGGQVSLNGEPNDISFNGDTMTVSSATASDTFIRLK